MRDANMPEIFEHGMAIDGFFFPYYFYINIPLDYYHETMVQSFRDEFNFEGPTASLFTDERFAEVTHKLIPGERYAVKVFWITVEKPWEECLEFIKKQNHTVLAGTQGLLFLALNHRKQLPMGTLAVSLDEKNALPVVDGRPLISGLYRFPSGKLDFNMLNPDGVLGSPHSILCFSGPVSSITL